MAGRCGCGGASSGADIQGQYGVNVTGSGTANDPSIVRFDPRVGNILANGLQWNETQHKLSARLSSDANNSLRYGSDGGLWASSDGGDPGPTPTSGATVNALPVDNLIAGIDGGGYLLTGDSTIRAERSALELGVDAAYIPVRALGDGSVVVWPHDDTSLARLTQGFVRAKHPDYTQRTPGEMTALEWRHVPLMAGQYRATSLDVSTGMSVELDPTLGYFASGEPPQIGGTFLCDVARDLGGNVVLILHVEDPDTYDELKRVIVNHGLRDSVIVVSSRQSIIETWVGEDVAAGVYNDTDYGTPPNASDIVALGAEWALIGTERADSVFTSYETAGLSTLAMWARYHSDWTRVNDTLEIRGAVTGDPVYYNGPETGYAYKAAGSNTVDFTGPQQRPGWFTAHRAHADVVPARRGHLGNTGGYWLLDKQSTWRTWGPDSTASDNYGTYYLQMGSVCPIVPGATTDSYAIIWSYDFVKAAGNIAPTASVALAFGVPQDHAMSDGIDANRTDLDKGYVYIEQFNGNAILFQMNGTAAPTTLASGNVGAHSGDEVILRAVSLQQDKIVVSRGDDVPISSAFQINSTPSWHGGYAYFGKRDYRVDAANDGKTQIRLRRFEVYTPWPQ